MTAKTGCRLFSGLMLTLIAVFVLAAEPSGKAVRSGKHCLWKITSRTNSIYLAGSVHLLKKESYPLDKAFYDSFAASDKLVLEANLKETNQEEIQKLTVTKGLNPEGSTLEKTLSPETYKLVTNKVAQMGMNVTQIGKLKPWLLVVTLTVVKLQQMGYDPDFGMDRHFLQKASDAGKEIEGLESAEYQINLLADLPEKTQEEMLRQTICELDNTEKNFNSIVEAWNTGNTAKLGELLLQGFKDFPGLYELLMSDRNKAWATKIETFLQKGEKVFIVVGVGHFAGKDNVITLLEKRGYSVKQL